MDPADRKFCPECGTANRLASKFCVKCGTPFPPPLEAPAPAAPAPAQPGTAPLAGLEPASQAGAGAEAFEAPTMVPGRTAKLDPPRDEPPARSDEPTRKLEGSPKPPMTPPQGAPPARSDEPTRKLEGPPRPQAGTVPPRQSAPPPAAPRAAAGPPAAGSPPPDDGTGPRPPVNNRVVLIGAGCLVLALVLLALAWGTFRTVAGFLPPTSTARPTAGRTPTAEAANPTEAPSSTPNADLSILQTAQAEQDATATAAAEEPTEEPTEAATEEPTEEPTEAATEEPTEEPAAALVVSEFSDEERQQGRELHDSTVATYSRLLFESFEEGNRTKARWNFGRDGRALVRNRYELTLDQAGYYNFDLWKQQPELGESYTIEAEVRFLEIEKFARVGVAFDMQEDTTQNWLYLIGSDGNWYVFRNESRIASGPLPSQYAINADTPYVLWTWRVPEGILFFFNGELIAIVNAEALEGEYPTGSVGVVAASGQDAADVPVTVVIDNLLVARAP